MTAPEVIAFDVETHLIQPGLLAPPLVCASVAHADGASLLSADEARSVFRELMRSRGTLIAGANFPFDVATMLADAERRSRAEYDSLIDLVFAKYERGEVYDDLLAQALDAIACGHLYRDPRTGGDLRDPQTGEAKYRYSLSIVTDLVLGRKDAKRNDYWRERHAILERLPLSEWPPDARQYPVDDAVNTREVALAQLGGLGVTRAHEWTENRGGVAVCGHCGVELGFGEPPRCVERAVERKPHRNLDGMPRMTRTDLALHLGATHGLRAHGDTVESLSAEVDDLHARYAESFRDWMKNGHAPTCLKRMQLAGVLPDAAGKTHCVKSCTHGKEDGPLVTRLVAIAYGATGVCPSCGGSGRRVGEKGNEVGCAPRNFKHEPMPAVTCDTTGLALYKLIANEGGSQWVWANPALPQTEGGGVKCDRDSLQESGDERLMAYGDDEHEKIRTTYVPFLKRAVDWPLTLSPNAALETFRVSYNGPIQQMPRTGRARFAFQARPGFYYASCDYSGIELCTLAQVCLWTVGFSRMAEIINETGDPGGLHAAFGAQMLGCDPGEFKKRVKVGDKAAKDFRQAAKAANFGFPGGMGGAKLCIAKRKKAEGSTYAETGPLIDRKGRRYYTGIRFCILLGGAEKCGVEKVTEWRERPCPPVCRACCVQADILRERWMSFFPEIKPYFKYVKNLTEATGEVRLPFPGTTRGGVGFTDGANGHFQELAAILGTTALWDVTRECYADRSSVLYGTTRIPFFVHDECFAETMIDTAHLAAARIGTIMVEAGVTIVPNVKIKVEPALSRRWLKDMEAAHDASGRLIPWEDSPAGAEYLQEKGWTL